MLKFPVGARPSGRYFWKYRADSALHSDGHSGHPVQMTGANKRLSKGSRLLRRGRFSCPEQIYHVTTQTLGRINWFDSLHFGRLVVRSLMREDSAGHTRTLAFVVMPDHLHWLLQLSDSRSLSVSVNTVKSYASRSINRAAGRSGPIWQKGFHDHALRGEEDLTATARYIVANSLRAGLTHSVSEYPLWDAIWL